jgi:hypothetical protein
MKRPDRDGLNIAHRPEHGKAQQATAGPHP